MASLNLSGVAKSGSPGLQPARHVRVCRMLHLALQSCKKPACGLDPQGGGLGLMKLHMRKELIHIHRLM